MKYTLIIGLLVIAILISGCVNTTPSPTAQPTMTATPTATMTATPTATMAQSTNMISVNISNFTFVPANITVTNGTMLTWTNNDTVQHTVTSVTGTFDSGNINPGATYSYTFNQSGSFEYSCTIHPSIPHGTVTVTT
jgi:plastocyanin